MFRLHGCSEDDTIFLELGYIFGYILLRPFGIAVPGGFYYVFL